MNKIGKIFFAIYIVTKNFHLNCAMNSSETEDRSFYNINEDLETLSKQLYNWLNVDTALWETNKTKLLLAIRNHSQQIAMNNLKIYRDVETANKRHFDNKPSNPFFNLTEVIQKVLKFIKKQQFNNSIEYMEKNIFKTLDPNNFYRMVNQFTSIIAKGVNYTELNEALVRTLDLTLWYPSNTSKDEDLLNQTRRIYHGKSTKFGNFPFMVSVHVMREFMCGGSIISKNLIITAASCVNIVYETRYDRENSNFLAIRVGSYYSARFGELIPILDIYFHPSYEPGFLRNNLAIAQFNIPSSLRENLKIMKIPYNQMEGQLNDDASIIMLGWGQKDVDLSGKFESLAMTKLDMYDLQSCMDTYTRAFVDDNNFCAGFTYKGGGACSRDVGGPAILSGVLVGVVSFGPPQCGTPGAPTVFTRIEYYINWIDRIVNESQMMLSAEKLATNQSDYPGLPPESRNIARVGPESLYKKILKPRPDSKFSRAKPISAYAIKNDNSNILATDKMPAVNIEMIENLRSIILQPEIISKLKKKLFESLGEEKQEIDKLIDMSKPDVYDNVSQPDVTEETVDFDVVSDNLETEEVFENSVDLNILRERTPDKILEIEVIVPLKSTTNEFSELQFTLPTNKPLEWEIEPDFEDEVSRRGFHGKYLSINQSSTFDNNSQR